MMINLLRTSITTPISSRRKWLVAWRGSDGFGFIDDNERARGTWIKRLKKKQFHNNNHTSWSSDWCDVQTVKLSHGIHRIDPGVQRTKLIWLKLHETREQHLSLCGFLGGFADDTCQQRWKCSSLACTLRTNYIKEKKKRREEPSIKSCRSVFCGVEFPHIFLI